MKRLSATWTADEGNGSRKAATCPPQNPYR